MAVSRPEDNSEIRSQLLGYFGHNEMMVDTYIRLYGSKIDMKAIQDVRTQVLISAFNPDTVSSIGVMAEETPSPKKISAGGDESPVYSIDLGCPSCKQKGIPHQELRAASLLVKYDPFLAPVYFSTGKYQNLNYLTCAVAVCPRCLFASPDKADFVQFDLSRRIFVQSQIPPPVIREIHDAWPSRRTLQESVVPDRPEFFQCPRSFAVALLSYRLADMRATIEADNKIPYSNFKRANYWVRMALLQRQSGRDETPMLEKALSHFKNTFYLSDFPSSSAEFQSCFVIFSLHLRFGQLKEARDYISVLEQSKKHVGERKEPNAAKVLDHWLDQCKKRWEDKDNPDLWNLPK